MPEGHMVERDRTGAVTRVPSSTCLPGTWRLKTDVLNMSRAATPVLGKRAMHPSYPGLLAALRSACPVGAESFLGSALDSSPGCGLPRDVPAPSIPAPSACPLAAQRRSLPAGSWPLSWLLAAVCRQALRCVSVWSFLPAPTPCRLRAEPSHLLAVPPGNRRSLEPLLSHPRPGCQLHSPPHAACS